MSDLGEFVEFSKNTSFEISSYDGFMDVLEDAYADDENTWFSFCSSGIKRSHRTNQTMMELGVNVATKIDFSPYNYGKAYHDVVVENVDENGVHIKGLDKPISRIIVFGVYEDQVELAKIKLENEVLKKMQGNDTKVPNFFYVRMHDHLALKVVQDWAKNHSLKNAG